MQKKMKRRLIYNIFATCLVFGATACSSDYLDTTPNRNTDPKVIFSSTANAKLAINGLSKLMVQQYESQLFNGEGSIKTLYGNFQGNDYQRTVMVSNLDNIANGGFMQNSTSVYDYYPWFYYYRIIGNANTAIARIDGASGELTDKKFIKAQALTFRAYCYSMLVQMYSKRWMDSNNGESRGVVLRLDESKGDMPTSSLAKCYEQIYKDLDDAIKLYQESGKNRNENDNHLPNLNAAYAVYARAALNREDWQTAAKYAALAREGYPLMSNTEYQSGFNKHNGEWIWSVYGSASESISYYQFFAYEGSNSSSTWCRTRPATISKELYDRIPTTDIRRNLFLAPNGDAYDLANNKAGTALQQRAKTDYAARLYSSTTIFAYMQMKSLAAAQPGVGEVNLFRSSEMYLIEAEAYCHLNREQEARDLLVDLNRNSGRDPEYSCNKSGADLLDEVRLYNRIELWGEGHDWFNYKRWGLPIERHSSAQGGNFLVNFAVTIAPSDNNGWTWIIPSKEVDYNSDILSGVE